MLPCKSYFFDKVAEAGGVASRVASAGGGVPQVVVHGETCYLVPVEQMTESPFAPVNAEKFSRDLAHRINEIMADPAKQTKTLYETLG